jgi:hypothetical protein
MRGNGDSWRWDAERHPYVGRQYISVIEPAEERPEPPRNSRRVPFGFGLRDERGGQGEWEGNPS